MPPLYAPPEIASKKVNQKLMVQASGQHANPKSLLETLTDTLIDPELRAEWKRLRKRLEPSKNRPAPKRRQLRLPQGAIQNAILEALKEATRPMSPKEVQKLVEQRVRRPVLYDTVCSFLTRSSKRHKTTSIHRVGKGQYLLVKNEI